MDKLEPDFNGAEIHYAEEAVGEFVVVCGESADSLEMADAALNTATHAIESAILADRAGAVRARWDDA